MATYKDMDACLPELRRRAAAEKDPNHRLAIEITINIITALPSIKVEEGILCKQCGWFDRKGKRCLHEHGMTGRLKPEMYCSYGSLGEQDILDGKEFDDFLDEEDEEHD